MGAVRKTQCVWSNEHLLPHRVCTHTLMEHKPSRVREHLHSAFRQRRLSAVCVRVGAPGHPCFSPELNALPGEIPSLSTMLLLSRAVPKHNTPRHTESRQLRVHCLTKSEGNLNLSKTLPIICGTPAYTHQLCSSITPREPFAENCKFMSSFVCLLLSLLNLS